MLIHDEPMAGILKSVFEGFANGRFDSIAAIVRYLEAMPDFPRDGRGLIRYSRVKNILTHPIYAGMVHAPTWKITLREGQHEAIVSKTIFERVQSKLVMKPAVRERKDYNADFVMRGAVRCDSCSWSLTSC